MIELINMAVVILILLSVLIFLRYLNLEKKILNYIQKNHVQLWNNLELNKDIDFSRSSTMNRFIVQEDYMEINDPELTRLCQLTSKIGKIGEYFAVVCIVLVLIRIFGF